MATTISINLLKNRYTLSEKEYLRERKIFFYVIVASAVLAVITVAISFWQLVLTRRVSGLEQKIAEDTEQLAMLTEASAKQIYLKSRLKYISSFLEGRSVAREAIQHVFSLSIPVISVTSTTFSSVTEMLVQVSSDNASTLGEAIKYFSEDTRFFLQAVSRGISRTEDGSYRMELVLTVPKETDGTS